MKDFFLCRVSGCETKATHQDRSSGALLSCALHAAASDVLLDEAELAVSARRAEIEHVLRILAAAWTGAPHLRLGQIIENARADTSSAKAPDSFYVKDAELCDALERFPK